MMAFDWKSSVKAVAPWLGTAIGTAIGGPAGPLVGMATKTLCNVLLGKDEAKVSELSAAVQGATHEQWLEIKRQDAEFKKQAQDLGFKKLEMIAGDKASARDMQTKTKSRIPAIMTFVLTIMVILVAYAAVFQSFIPSNRDLINIIFGYILANWNNALQFYYGMINKED